MTSSKQPEPREHRTPRQVFVAVVIAVITASACAPTTTPEFGKPCRSSSECAAGTCRVGSVDDVERCLPARTADEPGDSCARPLIARAAATPGVIVDQRIELAGAADDEAVVCGASGGADLVVRFTIPASTTAQPGIRVGVDHPGIALSLRQSDVDGCTELPRFGCAAAGTEIVVQSLAAGDYDVVLERVGAAAVDDEPAVRLVVERLACPPEALPFDEGRCVRTALVQPLRTPRERHGMVRLDDGTIVIVGGLDERGATHDNFEALDGATQRWRYGTLRFSRVDAAVTVLPTGNIFVIGGTIDERAEVIDFARTNGESMTTDIVTIADFGISADVRWRAETVAGRVVVLNDGEAAMGVIDTRRTLRECASSVNCRGGEACVLTQERPTEQQGFCTCVDPRGCDSNGQELLPMRPGRVAIERGVATLADTTLVMALDNPSSEPGVDEIAVLDVRLLQPVIETFKPTVVRAAPTLFALDDQRVLIIGGVGSDGPLDVVEILDVPRARIEAQAWRLPRPLAAPIVRALGGELLLLANDGSDQAWLLSPETGRARPAPRVHPRIGASSVTDGDSVVVVGGRADDVVTGLVERIEIVAAEAADLGDPVQCRTQPLRSGRISGNTLAATDVFRPRLCNVDSIAYGHDNLFAFTLTEPGSLRVFDFEENGVANADTDHQLYLLRGTCDEALEVACGDSSNPTALFAGALDPGDYLLVVEHSTIPSPGVETFRGTSWTANVLLDGLTDCPRDPADPGDDVLAGGTFAAVSTDQGPDAVSGTLCAEDVDHVVFEHWGGPSGSVSVAGIPDGQASIHRVTVDVDASVAAGHPVPRAIIGPPLGLDLADVEPGTFVVRLEASDEIADFGTWKLDVNQDCIADPGDSLTPELDDSTFERAIELRVSEVRHQRTCTRSDRELFILDAEIGRPASIEIDQALEDLRLELFEVTATGLGAARAVSASVDPNFALNTIIDLGIWTGPLALRVQLDPAVPADGDPLSLDDDYRIEFDQLQVGDSCSDPFTLVQGGERSGVVTGDATAFNDNHNAVLLGECTGYSSPGTEAVYAVHLEAGETLSLVSSIDGGSTDASLYILDKCVLDETACVAGVDVGGFGAEETLAFTNPGPAAEFFVVVDSFQGAPFTWSLQWSIEAAP